MAELTQSLSVQRLVRVRQGKGGGWKRQADSNLAS